MKYHNNEYTIVTEPPLGYEIWNIKDAPNGCLPFCRLKSDRMRKAIPFMKKIGL